MKEEKAVNNHWTNNNKCKTKQTAEGSKTMLFGKNNTAGLRYCVC